MNSDEGIEGFTRAAPKTGWSASGTLTTYDRSKRVSLQANFATPGPYTAQFSVQRIEPDGINNEALVCEADVAWSVEGNEVARRISVGEGAAISGNGQAVRVVVRDTTLKFGAGQKIRNYNIGILVSPGTRPALNQPAVLNLISDNAANDETDFGSLGFVPAASTVDEVIPERAGAISALILIFSAAGQVLPDQSVQVYQTSGGSAITAGYDPKPKDFVPLRPGTTGFSIVNHNAFTIYYAITLGIEG